MSSKIIRLCGHAANIFINYRREDSSGHAGRLFDALSDHFAGRLFMDVDTLEPGVDFVEAIEQAVGSCEVLIVVIGLEWLTVKDAAGQRRLDNPADFVRLELETALERKIRVIPVLVQDAPMPRVEELPASLVRLARRNAIEISDARWAYDAERLARTIQSILKEKDASAPAPATAPEMAAPPLQPPPLPAPAAVHPLPPPIPQPAPAPRRPRSGLLPGIGIGFALVMAALVAIGMAGYEEEETIDSTSIAEEPATAPATASDTSAEVTSSLESWALNIASDYSKATDFYLNSLALDGTSTLDISLTEGVEYAIAGQCDHNCSDLDLSIYDGETMIFQDLETDENPVLSLTAPRSGTFSLVVSMPQCNSASCSYGIGLFTKNTNG